MIEITFASPSCLRAWLSAGLIENDIDPIGIMLFGILAICLAWVWISDRLNRGESRYDRDERSVLTRLERCKQSWSYSRDHLPRLLRDADSLWRGGAPEEVAGDLARLSAGEE